MTNPDGPAPHDADWYARHADALGWGPETARVDPERAGFLERWVVGSVLDVGCATGAYVEVLARAGHEAQGVDHSEALVAWAREHRAGAFDVGDAYALPYENDAFDTVLALDLLEHVDDARALAEIVRVARRRVIVAVPARTPAALLDAGLLFRHHEDPSHRRVYEQEGLASLLSDAGLEVGALEPVGAIDWNGLLLESIRHRRRPLERIAHRVIFKVLRHVPPTRYASGWLAFADLPACEGER